MPSGGLDGSGYEEFDGAPGETYVLGLTVVPMGDHNAVDIANEVHRVLLQQEGCLKLEEELVYGEPLPVGPYYEGLYIDDHNVLAIVPESELQASTVHGLRLGARGEILVCLL